MKKIITFFCVCSVFAQAVLFVELGVSENVVDVSTSSADAVVKPKNTGVLVNVEGMVCDFCVRGLEKTFGKQEEVKNIEIDLEASTVLLNFALGKGLSDMDIKNVIEGNGISVVSISR